MNNEKIAVFDFDGTIVSKDTGLEFYKWMISRSPLRFSLFILFSPLAFFLMIFRSSRTVGFSIISYIATAFQSESIFRIRTKFIDHYFNEAGAVVFDDALEKIRMHQNMGHQLIIISGCPQWLLKCVTNKLGLRNIILIGSSQSVYKKGVLFMRHCFSINKVSMAKERGLQLENWYYGYSDGIADIYWLKYCEEIYVINPSQKKYKKFNEAINTKFSVEKWS